MKQFLVFFMLTFGLLLAGCSDEEELSHEMEELEGQISELQEENAELKKENHALQAKLDEQNAYIASLDVVKEAVTYETIMPQSITQYPQSFFSKAESDLDQDGEKEIIELYVDAAKMDNGEFAWDDGQPWLLVVKDEGKTYPLFHDYVQLGSLKFWVMEREQERSILLLNTGMGLFHLQSFTFDEEKGGYVPKTHFNPELTFLLHPY
ncbi:MAG: bZIP transcription factor [Bacillaceae bacterium]|nr:bZIP transcription factor [Bacillaceae bacterium]